MQDLRWLDRIGSPEQGIRIINRFLWNLSMDRHDQSWYVLAGDQTIFIADNRPAIDAFLYGMALAYSVLSEQVVQTFRAEMQADLGEDIAELER